MEPARAATNLKQLTELASLLPALSHNTAIKAYYDSSDKLLKNVRRNIEKISHSAVECPISSQTRSSPSLALKCPLITTISF